MPSKRGTVKIVDRKTGKPSKNFDYVGSDIIGKTKEQRQAKGGETAYRNQNSNGHPLFPKTVSNNIKRSYAVKQKGK